MEDNIENFDNHVNYNRASNNCGIRKNGRFPVNHRNQEGSYENQQNGSRYVRNNIRYGNPRSRNIDYQNTTQASQRQFYNDRYNERNAANNYPHQRRNTSGNYHQNKSNYSNNYKRNQDHRNESRGNYSNKSKSNKRNKPKEPDNLNHRDSLIWQLTHHKYECMICVSIIWTDAPTWACDNCYHIFHIKCIAKWAKSGENSTVRCPTCQKEFDTETREDQQMFSIYRCFCGKLTNPEFRRGTIPHSCNEICDRSLAVRSGTVLLECQERSTESLGSGSVPGSGSSARSDDSERDYVDSDQDEHDKVNCCDPLIEPRDGDGYGAITLPHPNHQGASDAYTMLDAPITALDNNEDIAGHDASAILLDGETRTPQQLLESQDKTASVNDTLGAESGAAGRTLVPANDVMSPDEMDDTPREGCVNDSEPLPQWVCRHSCALLCHPGPCPPCDAMATRLCQCTRTRMTTKCVADERSLVCGSRCRRLLNCKRHVCMETCHVGPCQPCAVQRLERCWCDAEQSRRTPCSAGQLAMSSGDVRYSCGAICSRALSCGQHRCVSQCHGGVCAPCVDEPRTLERCWCGRVTVASLRGGQERSSCLEPRPDCGGLCERMLSPCGHVCASQCHPGPCPPCQVVVEDTRCRCGRSVLPGMACSVATGTPNSLVCKKTCGKRLACGRHQCRERCCNGFNEDQHECVLTCGRALSCGLHSCELQCGHPGRCPTCPNVSFEELSCHCGAETSLPPISCGQKPPACARDCSRPQPCDHPVRHHCHPDSEMPCPPCTELTSKYCPGQHRVYHHVPCFRPVATCGLPCDQLLSKCEHRCQRLCHSDPCEQDADPNDSSNRCTQPCIRPRPKCGHPCGAHCHAGECAPLQSKCEVSITKWCICGLRCVTSSCADQLNMDCGSSVVECNDSCHSAVQFSKRMSRITLTKSYNAIHRHYASFFDEFCKNNFNFVVSIEKIFSDLSEAASKIDSQEPKSYRFPSISLEKAKFIVRFCSRYVIKPTVVYRFKENIANVIVEAEHNRSFVPKSILSKVVEEKYFKIFKPAF